MDILSWGNYPRITSNVFSFQQKAALKHILASHDELIPFGNGRSYGDSALASNIVRVRPYNYFLDFDQRGGLLQVQAGVLLSEIIEALVPRGWFLIISPGTKLITVGGAIASDVHGKNHHIEGCFSQCVEMFHLMLPDGEVVRCSRQENGELFRATCGGMGLTGVILDARIRLKRINSHYIDQTTIKTNNLKETFGAFEKQKDRQYSVAWIDCLAKGDRLGRSLLMVGDFCDDGRLDYQPRRKLNIPFILPSFVLNTMIVKGLNGIYYNKAREGSTRQKVSIDTFFYPLDAVDNWNRIYGRNGFTQYQFVLPLPASYNGLEEILQTIAAAGKGSFLAVLKLHGPANANYLSFPLAGYSLALDFKIERGLFEFLDRLDAIVLRHGGRIYLTKDVRVSRAVLEQGYPHIDKFRELRQHWGLADKFNSLQSRRVGI